MCTLSRPFLGLSGYAPLVELLGGIALLLGLLTRVVALALSAVLVGAILLVKVDVAICWTGSLSPVGRAS